MGFWDSLKKTAENKQAEYEKELDRLSDYSTAELKRMYRPDLSVKSTAIATILRQRGESVKD